MAKSKKPSKEQSVIETLQRVMCQMMYRTVMDKMISLGKNDLEIPFEKTFLIKFYIVNRNAVRLYFKNSKTVSYNSLGDGMDISAEKPIDIFFNWLSLRDEFKDDKFETYRSWLYALEKAIDSLIKEEKKYEGLIQEIFDLPLFSTERQVLIEKYVQ